MALEAVFAKIDRAAEHIQEIDRELSGRNPRTAYTVSIYRVPNTNTINLDQPLPTDTQRIPILIGEALYQLRSSLDHLVGELERINGRQRRTAFEFPVFWGAKAYARDGRKKIDGVSDSAKVAIENLQPFQRGDSYRDDLLWILHDLNLTDKHRVLIEVSSSILANNLDINIPGGARREWILSIAPHERAQPLPPELATHPDVHFVLSATFAMFGSIEKQPIIPGLQRLRNHTLTIVRSFVSEFPA